MPVLLLVLVLALWLFQSCRSPPISLEPQISFRLKSMIQLRRVYASVGVVASAEAESAPLWTLKHATEQLQWPMSISFFAQVAAWLARTHYGALSIGQ